MYFYFILFIDKYNLNTIRDENLFFPQRNKFVVYACLQ